MSSQADRLRQIHKEHKRSDRSDRSDKYEARIARHVDKLENEYQARKIFEGSRNMGTPSITISNPTIQVGGFIPGIQVGGFIPGTQVGGFIPGIQVGMSTGLIGSVNHVHIISNPRVVILPNGTYTII
jgi:hypothetical protein